MRNFRITTTLAIEPRKDPMDKFIKITKGATAVLMLNLGKSEYIVDYDEDGNLDFKQLTLTFKQPNGALDSYSYYKDTTERNIDEHFSYDRATKVLSFKFNARETANLVTSDCCRPMNWDMMVNTKDDFVLIERQTPIIVLESLYDETHHYSEAVYASNTIVCSSTISCNE